MKKIAMLMCLILALGWISNTGMLSIRYDNGYAIKDVPLKAGYVAVVDCMGTRTTVARTVVPLSTWFHIPEALVYANGQWLRATPMANGWLFSFKEIRTLPLGDGNASRLPNR